MKPTLLLLVILLASVIALIPLGRWFDREAVKKGIVGQNIKSLVIGWAICFLCVYIYIRYLTPSD